MRHQSLREVHQRADVQAETSAVRSLTRAERLERWVEVLRQYGGDMLTTLDGTEYRRPDERAAMRRNNSPITVAFHDPLLRGAGMRDDTYGEARRFFELSDHELHYVVCHCHCGARMSGHAAADRVRELVPGGPWLRGLIGSLRRWLH